MSNTRKSELSIATTQSWMWAWFSISTLLGAVAGAATGAISSSNSSGEPAIGLVLFGFVVGAVAVAVSNIPLMAIFTLGTKLLSNLIAVRKLNIRLVNLSIKNNERELI